MKSVLGHPRVLRVHRPLLVLPQKPTFCYSTKGSSDRRSRPLQDDDPRYARVHSPLPDARPPKGVPSHRHYGLLASNRAANIARARELLAAPLRVTKPEANTPCEPDQPHMLPRPCPCCGGRMIIIKTFARGCEPNHRPTPVPTAIRIDTS
jgi:hypothetical protein